MNSITPVPVKIFALFFSAMVFHDYGVACEWSAFRVEGKVIDSRGRSLDRRVLDVGHIAEIGWFGNAPNSDSTEIISVSRDTDLVQDMQELVSAKVGNRIRGLVTTTGNQPLTSFGKSPAGGYRITLAIRPAEGKLPERVLAFVTLMLAAAHRDNCDDILDRVAIGEIEINGAVEELLMVDYTISRDVQEFGRASWRPWRIANDLPESADEGWALAESDLGTFEQWKQSDYGVNRTEHWTSVVRSMRSGGNQSP